MSSSGLLRPPQVFVSYSHDSPAHMDRVLALCDRLRRDGIDAEMDQYEPAPAEGWPRWMLRRIEAAAVSGKFVPVVFAPEDVAHIPTILRGVTRYHLDSESGYEQLYRHLTGQPATARPGLGTVLSLPPKPRESGFPPPPRPGTRRTAWPLAAFLGGALALGGYLTFKGQEPAKQVLQGEILDGETRQPLPGVQVRLPRHGLERITDEQGQYRFEVAVAAGEQVKLRATKGGYEPIDEDPPAGTGHLHPSHMRRRR